MTKQLDPNDPQFKPEYQDKAYRQKAPGRWYQVGVDCGCSGDCYCLETRWTRPRPVDARMIQDTERWPLLPRPVSRFDQ